MDNLTEEQKQRMEENRKRALEKRAAAKVLEQQAAVASQGSSLSIRSRAYPVFSPTISEKAKFKDSVISGDICNPVSSHVNQPKPSASRITSKNHVPGSLADNNGLKSSCSNFGTNAASALKLTKGSFVLLTNDRFYVDIGYHQKMIEIFKSMPDRVYDAKTKRWSFPIKDHDALASKLKTLQPDVVFSTLPKNLIKLFSEFTNASQIPEFDLSSLDPVLLNALLPFQRQGVNFGIHHGGRVLIADDMGLGKTIQAIAIANYYKNDWPLLVVTPSSVRYSWAEAFRMWLPSESDSVTIINSGKDHITNDQIILMSYDILTKKQDEILKRGFKSAIMDESHFLKNPKSARTKAAQVVMKRMNRIIMLSGTPALSRPIELFPQISALKPKEFSNIMEYGVRYCNGRKMPWGWDLSGSLHMEELQMILEATVMIRRLKSDVIKQLPAKRRQMIVLDPSQVQSKSKVLRAISHKMANVRLKGGMERRGVLLEYFHETGVVKIPAICDYVTDLLEADKKFLCFAHHQIVMNGICHAIERTKIDYIRIDGSTSAEQRKVLCDKFQVKDSCKVAVLSITAANAGITLTAAHLVIFAELFWNPGILTQAEDRVHRIGQEDSVVVQYLVAKGTADDEIWPLVQKKLDILNKAGLSKDNFSDTDTVAVENSLQPRIEDFWKELDISIDFELQVTENEGKDGVEVGSSKRSKIDFAQQIS